VADIDDHIEPAADGPRPSTLMTGITAAILVVAVLSLLFAVLFIWYWAPFIMAGAALALGIPVYRAQRAHMTDPQPLGTVD
jgi:4-hydroxybenzoate polyprenyltransferase